MSSKLSSELVEVLNEVNSIHGGDALLTLEGTSGLWPIEKRMPTGSVALDLAIGIGGWGRGRLHQIAGEESSGKTSLALMTVASAQKRGENAVYIDAEMALDPNWASKIGVDVESLLISQPSSLESAIDIMVTVMETGKVQLLVVDSIPALKSSVVMEADASTETRALEPRRWSAQMPRVVKAAKENNVTVILINQVRDSMSMYGPPEHIPGGRTIKFAVSTTVKLKKMLEGRRNEDGIDYHDAEFDIIKNKQGSPFKKGTFTLWTKLDNPVDYTRDVYYTAVGSGFIEEGVKWDEDKEEFENKRGWFSIPVNPNDEELVNFIRENIEEDFDAPALSRYQNARMLDLFIETPGLDKLIHDRLLNQLNGDANNQVSSELDTETGESVAQHEDEEEDEE